MTIEQKTAEEVYKEYVGLGIERMSVIEEGDSMILLMDQTRILFPHTMRKKLMDREHLAHPGTNKMQNIFRTKYLWPGIEAGM